MHAEYNNNYICAVLLQQCHLIVICTVAYQLIAMCWWRDNGPNRRDIMETDVYILTAVKSLI